SLHVGAELQGMNSLREKQVVINLIIVPMKHRELRGAQPSGKKRQSGHADDACRASRRETEGFIRREWVNSRATRRRCCEYPVVAQPERIEQIGGEHVVLLERDELA